MDDVTARGAAAPLRGAAHREPAAAADCAAAGLEPAKDRRGAIRKADARRLAAAAAAALAVDVLALTFLSIFLSGMAGQAARDEEALWLSVDLGPPVVRAAARAAGTELASKTDPTSAPEKNIPARIAPEAALTSNDTGTELALGTELETSGNGDYMDLEAGTELSSPRVATGSTAIQLAGTELTTKEDLLHRLDEEITRTLSYPPRARSRGIEGRVLLDLRVDEVGRLEDCSVETSSGSALLDGAARRLITDIFPLHARLASSFSALVAVEYRLR